MCATGSSVLVGCFAEGATVGRNGAEGCFMNGEVAVLTGSTSYIADGVDLLDPSTGWTPCAPPLSPSIPSCP